MTAAPWTQIKANRFDCRERKIIFYAMQNRKTKKLHKLNYVISLLTNIVIDFESFNESIWKIRVKGRLKIYTILNFYALKEDGNSKEKEM